MSDNSRFAALLNTGETVQKLDLSGWIVIRNLLNIGDEIIIEQHHPLFDRDVRAKVANISSNNMLCVKLLTEGAKDAFGYEWSVEPLTSWLDVMWKVWKITLQTAPAELG